jgi:hypothetical protein
VLRKLFVCLLIFALTCSQLLGGAGPDHKQIAKVKKKVASCLENHRRVTIETYDDRLLQGFVSEAKADAFILGYNGKSTTLNYADVKKIKSPSEVSKQVKVVLGTAAVLGVIFGLVVLLGVGLRG